MAHYKAQGTRRVWLPAAAFGAFALILGARLVQIQVLQHDQYAAEAKKELSGDDTIFARRGSILDRNGGVLATSVDTWDIYVNPTAWRNAEVALKASTALAPMLRADAAALRAMVAEAGSGDVKLYNDLPYESGVALVQQGIPGLVAIANTARVNPEGDLGASVVGFIGTDNEGRAGLESAYDEILRGTPGYAIYERDTTGDRIPYGHYVAKEPKAAKTSCSPSTAASSSWPRTCSRMR